MTEEEAATKHRMYVCPGCGMSAEEDKDGFVLICPSCGSIPVPLDVVIYESWPRGWRFDAESDDPIKLNEPYPGEHSARLHEPSEYKKFRRQNDKLGDGIHAIWGQRKTDSKWELQAIRFSVDRWTVPTAKQWLKDHGYRSIRFEPATGGKESMETKHEYECLSCGHVMQIEKHCNDIKCSECGGETRCKDRPGPGQTSSECKECEETRALLDAGVLSLEGEDLIEFKGSPRNPYGSHGSYQFKGGKAGYEKSWRIHFSKINGGATTPAACGPLRGTIRRCEMISAVMKPPCSLPSADSISARAGSPSPLSGDFPEAPKDYGLSTWKKPSEAPEDDKDKAGKLSCDDLKVIKMAAVAELKRRIADREKKKDSMDQAVKLANQLATAEALAAYLFERSGKQTDNMLVEVFQPDKDHFFFEEVLDEQTSQPTGLLRIKAMVQRADEPNKNRRIYPYDILKRETEVLNKKAENRKSVSLLDHPVGMFVCIGERLWDACGRLCRTWMDDKEAWGEFLLEIQDNTKGRHLHSLLKTGFIPGVSSRGTGGTRPEDRDKTTFDVICDDYRLHGYDFVCNESVEGAEIKTFMKESTQTQEKENNEMEKVQIKEAVEEVIKPVLDQLSERERVEKEKHEAVIVEKDKEIETLKAAIIEKDKKIETLKPPETLKVEALKEAVAENEPYRNEVIELLAGMDVTKDSLSQKIEKARELVTKLLTSPKKGEEHGDKIERTIDPATDTSKVSENEAAFRKRGKGSSEE